jgi:hypothetical protein
MTNIPSANELVEQMMASASGVLEKNVELIQGFSKSQAEKIAQQTVWVAESDAAGLFKDNAPLRDHFLKGIDELIWNFAKTLQGIILTTLEKVWNGIVNVIWTALDKAVGFALPRPIF